MSSSKNISFAKNVTIQRSPRGYVIVSVVGTDVSVTKEMDSVLKSKIEQMPYNEHFAPWQQAMKELEKVAMEEARLLFNKWKVNNK